jgi:crotonobetainyl-CoA:carnitine CoA-transferase CaiB-like acyl-CoA transferase
MFHKTPWTVKRRAPLLGEDTREVLETALKLRPQDLVLLRESGAI